MGEIACWSTQVVTLAGIHWDTERFTSSHIKLWLCLLLQHIKFCSPISSPAHQPHPSCSISNYAAPGVLFSIYSSTPSCTNYSARFCSMESNHPPCIHLDCKRPCKYTWWCNGVIRGVQAPHLPPSPPPSPPPSTLVSQARPTSAREGPSLAEVGLACETTSTLSPSCVQRGLTPPPWTRSKSLRPHAHTAHSNFRSFDQPIRSLDELQPTILFGDHCARLLLDPTHHRAPLFCLRNYSIWRPLCRFAPRPHPPPRAAILSSGARPGQGYVVQTFEWLLALLQHTTLVRYQYWHSWSLHKHASQWFTRLIHQ